MLRELQATQARITARRRRRGLLAARAPADGAGKEHRRDNGSSRTDRALARIPTHCTMLYGHVETYAERVDHLLRLRELQDETAASSRSSRSAFHPENTVFEQSRLEAHDRRGRPQDDRGRRPPARQHPNIKAYWIMMGLPLSTKSRCTSVQTTCRARSCARIFHSAGATTDDRAEDRRARAVRARSGRFPVQRDTQATSSTACNDHAESGTIGHTQEVGGARA